MTRINQITASLALAMMFPMGGCAKDLLLQPIPSTDAQGTKSLQSFKLSGVPKKTKSAQASLKPPQKATEKKIIFVLGGASARERFAAKFAQSHPGLPIWVSSGSPEGYAQRVFAKAGIKKSRVHLDYQSVDTVTNFTSLVDRFQAEGINSVYLITSSDHMRRARVIGEIVFGSREITIKPVSVPSGRAPEPTEKCLRDGARAALWATTGPTDVIFGQGASITQKSGQDYTNWLDACYR
jgi:uncharacterized SAM-binding protein YcdF (DUF218 family)